MADQRSASWLASGAATLMIAEHVASKAIRDTFFLTSYGVTWLPAMFIVAAVASIAVVPVMSKVLGRLGPARVVTPAFGISAALLAVWWWLSGTAPRIAAVTIYLHVAAINAVLISWFWSLVNERFDPRTARREMRLMGGGAALGGLIGGLIAERAASTIGPSSMLLVLSALHVVCAIATRRLQGPGRARLIPAGPVSSAREVLRRSSYARQLGALVLVSTVAATLLDFVFKAQAVASIERGPALMRFFALFYAGTGVATFLVQTFLGHMALTRLGIARTVAVLPLSVLAGAIAALFLPGLPVFTLLRGAEVSIHSSLYRSAYELFFTPLPPADKRGIKTVIDVGFDRLGDAVGGGLIKLVLWVASAWAVTVLLGMAVALSLVVLYLTLLLHRGYVRTLEKSLRARSVEVDAAEVHDSTTLSVLRSFDQLPLAAPKKPAPAALPSTEKPLAPAPADPMLERIAALRSGQAERAQRALAEGPLSPSLVPHAVALLAWDETASHAIAALRRVVDGSLGQLLDSLLSPDEEFAIRRRIPRILEASDSPRAITGLLDGLDDIRFEVRYRCGRALARIHARSPDARMDRERIFASVLKEAKLDRGVWESQRLLDEDPGDEGAGDAFVGELLRDRASRSLEHVFTILSLAFPRKPLVLAFQGLYTSDAHLRGTALEYLEGMLPPEIRAPLWPFLEDRRPTARTTRPRQEVLDQLLLSNQSIQINLRRRDRA